MSEVQEGVIAEAPNVPATNTSMQQYAERRKQELLGSVQEETKEEVPETTEETEEVTEEVQEETPEQDESDSEVIEESSEEQSEDENEVLSQIDLDDMTDEELHELSEKLGSRAVARFGELTAKRKAAEAELQKLKSEMSKSLTSDVKDSENPYNEITSIDDLQKVKTEVEEVIEWAEDLIFNGDGYAAEDVITEVDGKELTKSDVRQHLLRARKAEKKFIPAQLNKIQRIENAEKSRTSLQEKAEKELPWMKEDGDIKKRYESMLNDSRLAGLKQFDAEVDAQLPYLLAHAANSMYGRKLVKEAPKSARLQPPSGTPGAAKSEKRVSKSLKNLQEASNRFKSSGDKNDFVRMRTLQFKS